MSQQPSLMKIPFAQNGAKATIPETTTSLGVASLSQGFPTETQLPLADGGVPPRRIDVNGALYMLSTFAMYQQTGGKFAWSSELDYDVPCIIYHNSNLWWCVQANGLSTPATLFGGTWVRIENRMILAAGSSYTAGSTGGSATKTLSVANMPTHSHSCSSIGNHTHTRGTMNITGNFGGTDVQGGYYGNGAFAITSRGNYRDAGGEYESNYGKNMSFDASRNWSGATSSNGNHQHTIGNNGSGTAFNIMPPYIVAYVWRRTA